jgi:hypothetical protein
MIARLRAPRSGNAYAIIAINTAWLGKNVRGVCSRRHRRRSNRKNHQVSLFDRVYS